MSNVVDSVTGVVGGLVGGITGSTAAGEAAQAGAATQAAAQREALEYLKEREALPQQFREGALTQIGGLYGLDGGKGSQQALIDQAMASPLYGAIMGGQQAGEEAIMRNAAATGGLRSGNVQANLADYNTQLQNKALLESYNQQLQGLQGMAQLPSNANQIASGISGVGQTLAQGQTAAGQAHQAGMGMIMSAAAQGAGAYFSDPALKTNIVKIGESHGHNVYRWTWNKAAEVLGLFGESVGVMADEIKRTKPEAVGERGGYMTVDYSMLGA